MPVIAGTGQVANKDEERIVHPMTLVEQATRAALAAAGAHPSAVQALYTTPLSALDDVDSSALLAAALGARPGPRVVSSYSGAAPQRLLAEACRAVAAGEVELAVVAGGIADASVRRARRAGMEPPAPPTSVWSQGSAAPPVPHRRDWGPAYIPEVAAGAGLPAAYFALVQSVVDGRSPLGERTAALGRAMAPFSAVAARRPQLAWFATERSAQDIATVSPANRMVAEPYTKLMCSFPTVDQAAALVVTAGPRPGAVHPWAVTTAKEAGPPSSWPDMSRPGSLGRAVAAAAELSGADPAQVGVFDLYSCFPAAVGLAARELGLDLADPRGLTASGGLPYFGGPGASYSLHGLACLFEEMSAREAALGLAVGVGGMVTDFSVGVYSFEPAPFASLDIPAPAMAQVLSDPAPRGRAVVDAMTVLHRRDDGPVDAPVIARTASGRRFGARLADPSAASALAGCNLVGAEIEVVAAPGAGRLTYTPM